MPLLAPRSVLWREEKNFMKFSKSFHFGTKQDCIVGTIILVYALLWICLLAYCIRLSKNRFEEIKRTEAQARRRSTMTSSTYQPISSIFRSKSVMSSYEELLIQMTSLNPNFQWRPFLPVSLFSTSKCYQPYLCTLILFL